MGWIGRILAVVAGLAGLAFWGFGALDMYWTLTGDEAYLANYSAELIAWLKSFPLWRNAVWGASIGFGVLGALLLLFRSGLSGHVSMIAVALLLVGLGHDLLLADGVEMYGQTGLIGSAVIVGVAIVLTAAGYLLAARRPATV